MSRVLRTPYGWRLGFSSYVANIKFPKLNVALRENIKGYVFFRSRDFFFLSKKHCKKWLRKICRDLEILAHARGTVAVPGSSTVSLNSAGVIWFRAHVELSEPTP